jgi:hypothetical protein
MNPPQLISSWPVRPDPLWIEGIHDFYQFLKLKYAAKAFNARRE